MDIIYQWTAIIIGLFLGIPIIITLILVFVGLVFRFTDISSLPDTPKQLFMAGDSLGVQYLPDPSHSNDTHCD